MARATGLFRCACFSAFVLCITKPAQQAQFKGPDHAWRRCSAAWTRARAWAPPEPLSQRFIYPFTPTCCLSFPDVKRCNAGFSTVLRCDLLMSVLAEQSRRTLAPRALSPLSVTAKWAFALRPAIYDGLEQQMRPHNALTICERFLALFSYGVNEALCELKGQDCVARRLDEPGPHASILTSPIVRDR